MLDLLFWNLWREGARDQAQQRCLRRVRGQVGFDLVSHVVARVVDGDGFVVFAVERDHADVVDVSDAGEVGLFFFLFFFFFFLLFFFLFCFGAEGGGAFRFLFDGRGRGHGRRRRRRWRRGGLLLLAWYPITIFLALTLLEEEVSGPHGLVVDAGPGLCLLHETAIGGGVDAQVALEVGDFHLARVEVGGDLPSDLVAVPPVDYWRLQLLPKAIALWTGWSETLGMLRAN